MKASVLAAIIITTIVILFLLNKVEVCKKNRFPICYVPLKWSSSNTGSRLQPSAVNGFKPEPKEYFNISTSASTNTVKKAQPHPSNRSTTKLDAIGTLTLRNHARLFLLETNSIRDSTTELTDSSISTHALVTEETWTTTKSPVENVLLKDSAQSSITSPLNIVKDISPKSITTGSVEMVETVTTHAPVSFLNDQISIATDSVVTKETAPTVDLLLKDSTTITILVEPETTHPPVNNVLLEDNTPKTIATSSLEMEENAMTYIITPVLLKAPESIITGSVVTKESATTLSPVDMLKDSSTKSTTTLVSGTTLPPVENGFLKDSTTSSAERPTSDEIIRSPSSSKLFKNSNRHSTTTTLALKETVTTHSPLKVVSRVSTINLAAAGATHSTFHKIETGPSFNQSFTDILPRSVYFDSRRRDGHNNATVILVQVLKTVFMEKRVVGCGVDDHFTNQFLFKPLGLFTPYVHKRQPWLTHDQAMLTCYDLPAHQGSRVFVLYKDETETTLKIETEKRLYIPSTHKKVPVST